MGKAKAVTPVFTMAQARALRVAISWARESEDGTLNRTLANAHRQLNAAIRAKS